MSIPLSRPFVVLGSNRLPGGVLYGANGQTITGNSNGAWAIAANGTNQNITLTPSGTGRFDIITNTASTVNALNVNNSGAGTTSLQVNNNAQALTLGVTSTVAQLDTSSASLDLKSGGTLGLRVATSTRNILLGGLTTDGTGVLQFPAATTSAGGITFGTDVNLFRSGAGALNLDGSGNVPVFNLATSGTTRGVLATSSTVNFLVSASTGSLLLQSNNTLALTLDSSQNATFAGAIFESTDTLSGAGAVSVTKTTTKYTSTGGSQALTLANGTDGQIKRVIHDVDGGSGILTPTTKTGYTTVTFTNAGDSVTLQYVTTRGWIVISSFGVTIA